MRINDMLLVIVIKSYGTMLTMAGTENQKPYARRLLAVLQWLQCSRPQGREIWDIMVMGVTATINDDPMTALSASLGVAHIATELAAMTHEMDEQLRQDQASLN